MASAWRSTWASHQHETDGGVVQIQRRGMIMVEVGKASGRGISEEGI